MTPTMKKQLERIRDNPCVMVNGTMRDRRTMVRYRITKKMLDEIVSGGYIRIVNSVVTLTDDGYFAITKGPSKRKTAKDIYAERKAEGYVSRQVWVHRDSLDAFDTFVSNLEGCMKR